MKRIISSFFTQQRLLYSAQIVSVSSIFACRKIYNDQIQPQHNIFLTENDIETDNSKLYFHTDQPDESQLKIFSGSTHRELAKEIVSHLDIQLSRVKLERFQDGEIYVNCLENVQGQEIYIVQTMKPPHIHDALMELIFMVSIMKREGAAKMTCVIPFLAYSRQTSQGIENTRKSLLAPSIADMLEAVGCDQVITINYSKRELKGFFAPRVPCLNIDVNEMVIPYFVNKNLKDPVIISNSARTRRLGTTLQLKDTFKYFGIDFGFGFMNETSSWDDFQYLGDEVFVIYIYNYFKGRNCLIISEIIDQGKHLKKCTMELKKQGANHVYYFAPHGLLTGDCLKNIKKFGVKQVLVTNTLPEPSPQEKKIDIISISKLLAEIISQIHKGASLDQFRSGKSYQKYLHDYATIPKEKIQELINQKN